MSLPKVYTGARLRWLALLVATGAGQAAAALLSALLMERALDSALTGSEGLTAASLLGGLTLLGVLAGTARWVERYGAECLGQSYVHQLRAKMFDTLGARAGHGSSISAGAVSMRFVSDLNALRQWISLGQSRLIVAGSLLGAVLAYLATLDGRLAAVVCLILTGHGGVSFALGAHLETAVATSRRERSRLAASISDKAHAMQSITTFGRLRGERQRLERKSAAVGAAMNTRAFWAGSLRAASEVSVRLTMAVVIAVGLYQLRMGHTTPGQILAAVSVIALLTGPVRDISRAYEYWKAAKISRQKLEHFLSAGRSVRRGELTPVAARGDLRLVGVSTGVQTASINATVPAGTRLAVLGPNGVGKTTLLTMLAGVHSPADGEVMLDEQPLHQLGWRGLQDVVGIASADLPLVSGTLRRNIRYRLPEWDETALEDVCRRAGIIDVLGQWPEVLTRRVSRGGANLSCGERARIQLARALLGNPCVLVLDELDSHLDEQGLSVLRNLIVSYPGTIIYSTHNPDLAALADQIWLMTPDGIRFSQPPLHSQTLPAPCALGA